MENYLNYLKEGDEIDVNRSLQMRSNNPANNVELSKWEKLRQAAAKMLKKPFKGVPVGLGKSMTEALKSTQTSPFDRDQFLPM